MPVEDMSEDADVRLLQAHVAELMEHFDAVQIFATKQCGDGTVAVQWGGGNWYARRGQVAQWVVKENAAAAREVMEDNE